MNATTQNTWTSYRDGRRVIHTMKVEGARIYIQKVREEYSVSRLENEGDGVPTIKARLASLAKAKAWVDQYLCAAAIVKEHEAPSQVAAIALGDDELYECEIPGTPGRVTYAKDVQVVGRALRTYQLEDFQDAKAEHDRGQSFLANSARQLGVNYFEGRDVTVEYAFASENADPKTLEFRPLPISAKLSIISFDEAIPGGDSTVQRGYPPRCAWNFPAQEYREPSAAFPNGFATTIYFPMRKGIRSIVIKRKAK